MSGRPKKKKLEYITPTGLRGKRYWTDKMITDLLGEPDKVVPNPHYRVAAPMKLYLMSRVKAIETVLDVDAMKKNRERRSAAARQAAANRAYTCNLQCEFDEPLAVVVAKGAARNEEMREYYRSEYEAYVERCMRRGDDPEPMRGTNYPEVEAEHRWAINYLRHECTAYDSLLYRLGGSARDDLRERVHEAIGEAYPELAESAMEMTY